tara:strand:- start:44 stop:286 length:243 start_codon:yes stop_codon:yes gene_type:complete
MITTKRNIYLLKFRNSSELFIFQSEKEFLDVLKLPNSQHGIEYVKYFNKINKFNYLKKKDLRNYFSYNTEVIEVLNKIRF